MTVLCEHGRLFAGCYDCDPPLEGRPIGLALLVVMFLVLAVAMFFAVSVLKGG